MNYSELVEGGASETQIQGFLAEGDQTAVTFRVPKNLKEAATETARLRGVSFSAFLRSCVINELTSGRR
ncbi:hypothetical protein [Atopobium sp. oral taxon 416]|jgi:predicted DNA binding CopG/RHH family protein|uniref:hypothetical protein n=1 Tax=Atopobium sp. oral taxon 416 TaxID=712157 RepID=UPI002012F78A|nr:hypothetical protein [Atopobium sp. oral taxon 416]